MPSCRSDGIASPTLERLDQLEHLLARLALLRHMPVSSELGLRRACRREPRPRCPDRRSGSAPGRRRARARSPTRARCAGVDARGEERLVAAAAKPPSTADSSTSAVIGGASTLEEDVRVGAELLEHLDVDLDRRQPGRERRVLEALRPDAEHDPSGRPAARGKRHAELPEAHRVVLERRLDEVHRGRADERGDEEVVRLCVELLRACRPAGSGRRASPRRAGRASSPRSGRA